ncbi:MAG TPA: hypothetical protein VFM46_13055, partial [Pseudomonadales bacterium]|nr:hypothetical protein [Pseudomonadales bacterium]
MNSRLSASFLFVNLLALLVFASALPQRARAAEQPALLAVNNAKSAIGINISSITYWSTEWVFTDFLKPSSGWLTQCYPWSKKCQGEGKSPWNTKENAKLVLDENGWIKAFPKPEDRDFEFVSTFMFGGTRGRIPAGFYHVLYDGEGVLEYGAPAIYHPELSKPGHDVIELKQSALDKIEDGGVLITLKSTGDKNGNNYLRNLHFIAPGGICDNNAAWYAEDENSCKKYGKNFTP